MNTYKVWLDIKETAARWGITPRRVRALCAAGKVFMAKKTDTGWLINSNVRRPADGRALRHQTLPDHQRLLLSHLTATLRDMRAEISDNPPSDRDWRLANQMFLIEATHRMQTGTRGALTKDEVMSILTDRPVPNKSLARQSAAVRYAEVLARTIDQAHKGKRIEAKLVREINSLVRYGHPDARDLFEGNDMEEFYNRRLKEMLDTYQRSKEFITIRITKLMLTFQDLEPFATGNIRTLLLLANHLLVAEGYPPTVFRSTRIVRDYENFQKFKNVSFPVRTITRYVLHATRNWNVLLKQRPPSCPLFATRTSESPLAWPEKAIRQWNQQFRNRRYAPLYE